VPNFVRFDAGMLKLQQMIKWDVFLEHGVDVQMKMRQLVTVLCFK